MYVRVINTQAVANRVDDAVSTWRDKVAPTLKQAKGFKGAYLTGDRESGKAVTITMWETREDADAMNATLPQIMALFEGMFAGPPTVETYEVLLQV